ncbi:YgdI/YgdR family lipoprotein [Azotobacter sp. CWF10]
MKTRNVPSVVLLLSAILLAGCSGPAIVTLKDGRQLKTTDTPAYDRKPASTNSSATAGGCGSVRMPS